jgi:hypothetical protein
VAVYSSYAAMYFFVNDEGSRAREGRKKKSIVSGVYISSTPNQKRMKEMLNISCTKNNPQDTIHKNENPLCLHTFFLLIPFMRLFILEFFLLEIFYILFFYLSFGLKQKSNNEPFFSPFSFH